MADPSSRRRGWEVKAFLWAARHPGMWLIPTAVMFAGSQWDWRATGITLGAVAFVMVGWFRAHPDTFDQYAAPYVRAWWRRWTSYLGPRWHHVLRACELSTTHRKTNEERFPRITRARSYSSTVDTLHVRIVAGQSEKRFENKTAELAHALRVERIAVEQIKPGTIGLVVQRREPFTTVIPAPEMPETSEAVNLNDVYLGETEYGKQWRIPVLGKHLFVAGNTGAGKNSIPMSILRSLAPMIRDGLVRVWIADPKQFEFSALRDIAYRYAATGQECADLVTDFVADMQTEQQVLSASGTRRLTISRETPVNLLIVDEMAALLAYGDPTIARQLRGQLSLVGSQGRASGHTMIGLVQEPTKDTVSIRDLFTWRICLRLTVGNHVDGVLGEDARLRGARADEIPDIPEAAGIGYVIRPRKRVPVRVRAAYVSDADIAELVRFVTAYGPIPRGSVHKKLPAR